MSILFEFIHGLFVALVFEFVVYVTGSAILRIVSFGALTPPIHSFNEFKEQKEKSNQVLFTPSIVGVLFYILLILTVAWFN